MAVPQAKLMTKEDIKKENDLINSRKKYTLGLFNAKIRIINKSIPPLRKYLFDRLYLTKNLDSLKALDSSLKNLFLAIVKQLTDLRDDHLGTKYSYLAPNLQTIIDDAANLATQTIVSNDVKNNLYFDEIVKKIENRMLGYRNFIKRLSDEVKNVKGFSKLKRVKLAA